MYKCDFCGSVFDHPTAIIDPVACGHGMVKKDHAQLCPICGERGHFTKVIPCPICGEDIIPETEHICQECKRNLKTGIGVLLNALEPAELAQLDQWLDGASILDYKDFQ